MLTRGFLAYSQHQGFVAGSDCICQPRDKLKVGRGVSYVREHFFKGWCC